MPIYEILQCGTCKKSQTRQILESHVQVNKCDITYKCVGSMSRIGTTENASNIDLSNTWKSRFDDLTSKTESAKSNDISILTGNNKLSIAITKTTSSSGNFNLYLQEISTEQLQATEYSFVRGPGTVLISGKDDSSLKKLLRFSSTDNVIVFLNGVKLLPDQYNLVVTISATIKLLVPVNEPSNKIQIHVYKTPNPTTVTIPFYQIEGKSTAWGNISSLSVQRPSGSEVFDIMIADLSESGIKPNATYTVAANQSLMTNQNVLLLLSFGNSSAYDRNMYQYVDLLNSNCIIRNWNTDILVSSDFISNTFPSFSILTKSANDFDDQLLESKNTPSYKALN